VTCDVTGSWREHWAVIALMADEILTHFYQDIWWSEGPLTCLFCEQKLTCVFEHSSPDRRYAIRSCWDCMEFIDDYRALAQYLRCSVEEIRSRQLIVKDSPHGRDVRQILP